MMDEHSAKKKDVLRIPFSSIFLVRDQLEQDVGEAGVRCSGDRRHRESAGRLRHHVSASSPTRHSQVCRSHWRLLRRRKIHARFQIIACNYCASG